MLLERLDELKSIMTDNGTYIHLPPVGSQASLVSVFGDHRVNIQRTCRAVMQLVGLFLSSVLNPFLLLNSGLPILRRIVLALAYSFQCLDARRYSQPGKHARGVEAHCRSIGRRSRLQEQLL
jgi:hypothetical protein